MAGKQGKEKEIAVMEKGRIPLPNPRAERKKERTLREISYGLQEQVSDLFGKLNLTAKEKDTLVLEDTEDSDLAMIRKGSWTQSVASANNYVCYATCMGQSKRFGGENGGR